MKSSQTKTEGMVNRTVGKVKQQAGHLVNDQDLVDHGLRQEGKGNAQKIKADIKDQVHVGAAKVGQTVQKIGKKIENADDLI